MQFNSIPFLIFFLFVYLFYISIRHQTQNVLLLLSSYFFYGWWDWRFLALLWISTGVDYFCGKIIYKSKSNNSRKLFLVVSICTNLGILGFFKYFNFFIENSIILLRSIGLTPDTLTLEVILPVGISFYTFQTLSYTVDIYRGRLEPTSNLINFALFVSYFPQLVAGPIERANNLLPQIEASRKFDYKQIREGFWLILLGYYKKVVIADNFAKIADAVFNAPDQYQGMNVLFGIYAFAFQIYGDFSGYSDIARGLSKLFGIELMVNFRMPYFAINPSDFWRRWHISLSTWLRDYLYIPLGGSRLGTLKTIRNLSITMILGGLWHGAAWNFILWGIYHGLLLSVYRAVGLFFNFLIRIKSENSKLLDILKIVFMFHLICLGWVLFRVNHISDVITLTNSLLIYETAPISLFLHALFLITPLIILQILKEKSDNLMVLKTFNPSIRLATYLFFYGLILVCGVVDHYEFIYFQF